MISKKSNFIYNFFLIFISFFISIVGVEIFLRLSKLGYNSSPLNPSSTSHHEHPYNFEFNSYSPNGEWQDFLVRYDKYGNRVIDKNCNLDSLGNNLDLIFIGDSFLETKQVITEDSFPGIIQDHFCSSGAIVHNFGVSSYSPILSFSHLIQQIRNNRKLSLSKGSHIIHILYYHHIIKYVRFIIISLPFLFMLLLSPPLLPFFFV